MSKFIEPQTYEEALAIRDEFVTRQQEIQTQLANKNRIDPSTGLRLNDYEFHEWRARAVGALRYINEDLRKVKAVVRKFSDAEWAAKNAGGGRTEKLLVDAYVLLHRLAGEGVELDTSELALLDAIREQISGRAA